MVNVLIFKQTSRIFLIEGNPESILILPKRFKHMQVRKMSTARANQTDF